MSKLVTELFRAIANDDLAGASRALRKGANPDGPGPQNRPPLIAAAMQGAAEMVKVLLAGGADVHVTAQGFNALHYAINSAPGPSRSETVRALLRGGLKPDVSTPSGKVSPFWYAIERDDGEIVGMMLDHGARPNHPLTPENFTPLMLAGSSLSGKSATLLLQAGADPRAGDHQ